MEGEKLIMAGLQVLERIRTKEGYASRIVAEGAGRTNALELAILGKARSFIKSQVGRVALPEKQGTDGG
jgi:hypothetical protein